MHEQLTNCQMQLVSHFYKYVDSDGISQEHFIYFVERTKGITEDILAKILLEEMRLYGLDPRLICGQGYDGGGNLAGKCKGTTAVTPIEFLLAAFFHCGSFQLNLWVANSTGITSMALSNIQTTYSNIAMSCISNVVVIFRCKKHDRDHRKVGDFIEGHPRGEYVRKAATATLGSYDIPLFTGTLQH